MSILQKLLSIKNQLSLIHNYEDLRERSIDLARVKEKLAHISQNKLKTTPSCLRIYKSLTQERLYLTIDLHVDYINNLLEILNKWREAGDMRKTQIIQAQIIFNMQNLVGFYQDVTRKPMQYAYQFNILSKAERLMPELQVNSVNTNTQKVIVADKSSNSQTSNQICFFKDQPKFSSPESLSTEKVNATLII